MKNKEQLILISGLPPSNGGVGRLMKNLVPLATSNGYSVVTKRESLSIRALLNPNGLVALLREIFMRSCNFTLFFFKTYFLKNRTILFIHPQTAGFNLLNRLISRNKVYLYIMDNSFFCIRSYNIHPILRSECTRCLGDSSKFDLQCSPFPVEGDIKKMISALQKLQKNANRVTFLAQNNNQAKLLRQHFGVDSAVIVVGMDTGEIYKDTPSGTRTSNYDIVFHGSANIAKGSLWFVEVAECLPKLNFFMPCAKSDIESLLGRNINGGNITFCPCSWESGLREAVESAKLVCVPSLWSAPIEGALIKSIFFNGNVAVVKTDYGFSQEISENVLLHLSPDPRHAALEIAEYLSCGVKVNNTSRQWLELFYSKNSYSNVFEVLGKAV